MPLTLGFPKEMSTFLSFFYHFLIHIILCCLFYFDVYHSTSFFLSHQRTESVNYFSNQLHSCPPTLTLLI